MGEYPKLMMLQTCPYCWKVRSLLEHLKIDFSESQLNPLRRKKSLKFAGDWGKVPIWRESEEDFVIDSTPIMLYLDKNEVDEAAIFDALDNFSDDSEDEVSSGTKRRRR